MAPKAKDKVVSAKGNEAEEMVLKYLKKVNRPYASTDISANLKAAVSKPVAQKCLLSLAEKGKLTKKEYGKQTIFVIPQEDLGPADESSEKMANLDTEAKELEAELEENKRRAKRAQAERDALTSAPTDDELGERIESFMTENARLDTALLPLRAGAPPISQADLDLAATTWAHERSHWTQRRKTYLAAFEMSHPESSKAERKEWEEDVGVEGDSEEAIEIEKGPLGVSVQVASLKRKRP